MTEKEKNEYKRNKEFYTLEFHRRRHKKILLLINICLFHLILIMSY